MTPLDFALELWHTKGMVEPVQPDTESCPFCGHESHDAPLVPCGQSGCACPY
jgi:hypothetical protein